MMWRILTEPVFKGIFSAMLEPTRDKYSGNIGDESVASFLTRRLGSSHIANNIVSAVFHGVYAGDVHQLSVKSLMPTLRLAEDIWGSLGEYALINLRDKKPILSQRNVNLTNEIVPKIPELQKALQHASVYSFKTGIGALTGSLEDSLRARTNVKFSLDDKIDSLTYDGENDGVKV